MKRKIKIVKKGARMDQAPAPESAAQPQRPNCWLKEARAEIEARRMRDLKAFFQSPIGL